MFLSTFEIETRILATISKGKGMSTSYRIYTPLTQTTLKNVRKSGILTKRMKKLSDEEVLGQTVFRYKEILHTLDFLIMAEEYYWSTRNRPSIFIESESVARRLLEATYDVKWIDSIDMPFDSFILSMPKNFQIDGVTIPGCLVTWMPFNEMENKAVRPFCKKAGIPEPSGVTVPSDYEKSMTIHISYQDPYDSKKAIYARCVIPVEFFEPLLKSTTLDEFRDIAGDYQSTFVHLLESSEDDLKIQFTLLKIILAMSVYNQATEGSHLVSGLPGTKIQIDGMIRSLKPNHRTLRMPSLKKPDRSSPHDHYRSFHFRQLRSDRYYKGEYQNYPKGSRWTFVSDAWVSHSGKSIEPYTQKTKD